MFLESHQVYPLLYASQTGIQLLSSHLLEGPRALIRPPAKNLTTRLHQIPTDSIPKASCSPVAPVMDWTEEAELHKRYMEWKEEVELEIGSTLSGKSNSVKSNYVLRWAG